MAARLNSSLMTVCHLVGHPRRICKRSLFIYVYSPFLTLLLSTSDSMAEFQAALNPLILIYLAYIFVQFHS